MKFGRTKITLLTLCFFVIMIFSSTMPLYSQKTKIRITKVGAVLKLRPNDESLTIKELPIGSEFSVEEIIREWIKIKLPPDSDGIVITGYIHISFVEIEMEEHGPEQKKEPIVAETPKRIELPKAITDDEYTSWKQKLESAKSRKKAGDVASIIGAIFSVLGTTLYYTDEKEITDLDIGYYTTRTTTTYEKKNEYLLVSLGGLIISVVGFVISAPAKDELRLLEMEGAKKGYIIAGIAPTKGGVAFYFKLSF